MPAYNNSPKSVNQTNYKRKDNLLYKIVQKLKSINKSFS